jgi:acetylornithine deacetylase
VSFGTEAGLYQQAGLSAMVRSPGEIVRAHRPEEFITRADLAATVRMISSLSRELCATAA